MPTGISWTDETWNPVAGCRKVSVGCDHCYAIRSAHRMAGNPNPTIAAAYAGLTQVQNGRLNWTGVFRELPDRLDQPLQWARPRRIFVNSMSDLFGEGISDAYISRVFAIMALAKQHQFQILTKRPERMAKLLTYMFIQPLPNVWLGVSVEDQKAADARIPLLLQTPAAVRFLSCEPLLGPLDLRHVQDDGLVEIDALTGDHGVLRPLQGRSEARIVWVIAGAESGPGARPMDDEWVRSLKNQCVMAGTAFFYKQNAVHGRKIHTPELDGRRWLEYPR